MNTFLTIVAVVDGILVVAGAIALIFKPIRTRIFKDKEQRDGIMCLLRSQMMSTFYHCRGTGEIRQYEYENFIACYKAYKAMGGNSFIDHIKEEIDEYKIVS
jgi:hypothetical protein